MDKEIEYRSVERSVSGVNPAGVRENAPERRTIMPTSRLLHNGSHHGECAAPARRYASRHGVVHELQQSSWNAAPAAFSSEALAMAHRMRNSSAPPSQSVRAVIS